ncbi:unnamed protein product [Rangifer tarandus platyrhynchus]|uniref:Uncharacterized protein n=1 Tax=Rangifer tarandus platyrhynchus TaxID=3082113 RepID=A0ABN8ZY03_RANTA|nr:unnamed protein product [Rangifer tarandus platyrhynchus]
MPCGPNPAEVPPGAQITDLTEDRMRNEHRRRSPVRTGEARAGFQPRGAQEQAGLDAPPPTAVRINWAGCEVAGWGSPRPAGQGGVAGSLPRRGADPGTPKDPPGRRSRVPPCEGALLPRHWRPSHRGLRGLRSPGTPEGRRGSGAGESPSLSTAASLCRPGNEAHGRAQGGSLKRGNADDRHRHNRARGALARISGFRCLPANPRARVRTRPGARSGTRSRARLGPRAPPGARRPALWAARASPERGEQRPRVDTRRPRPRGGPPPTWMPLPRSTGR